MKEHSETHAVCNKHNIGVESVCCECSGKTDCSEPQKLTVTFVFKVEHAPNLESHLHFVLKKYLQEKGITLNDDNTVEV